MTEKTCKECGHLCHCMEADHDGCECENDRIQNSEGVDETSTNQGTTSEDQD